MAESVSDPGKRAALEALRNRLKQKLAAQESRGVAGPRRVESAQRPEHIVLSGAQRRLWYLDQAGAADAYHLTLAIRLRGRIDARALRRTLDEVVRRHEVLRSAFPQVSGEPVQLIRPSDGFALHEIDMLGPADDERLMQLCAAELRTPFVLDTGPLIRGRLVRVGPEDHLLLVTAHHIVFDGWSRGVMIREITELYAAFEQGRESPLSALPIQYADYAIWQQGWMQSDAVGAQVDYWRKELADPPALLELPTDRPRPVHPSYRGDSIDFSVGIDLANRLRALARSQDVTTFMVLQAALAVVLAKLSGQDDIVIGTPVANRRWENIEGSIGCFVNSLALRTRLAKAMTVRELLRQIKQTTLGAYEHQDLPFEKVVESLQLGRSTLHNPVYQVVLALQNTPQGQLQLPGLALNVWDVRSTAAVADLTLLLHEAEGDIAGRFNYATELFDRQTTVRWADHFKQVLTSIVRDSEQRVSAIPLVRSSEARVLVDRFNRPSVETPIAERLHGVFEVHASHAPHAVAVSYEDEQVTYAQLNARANQLAHLLLARGARSNTLIVALMPRSLELLIAQLAILKIGSTYVPVDPNTPKERQQVILRDCGAAWVLATQKSELQSATLIDVVGAAEEISLFRTNNVGMCTSHAPAYVMYTSGSTGMPKGVAIQHASVIRLCVDTDYVRADRTDCIAHCSNPAFDASTFEIWTALLNGARVAIIPQDTVLEPATFERVLREQGVTVMFLTVALFNQCVAVSPGMFASLKYLLVGGDAVEPGAVRQVLRSGAPRHLLNGYGPTETTTFACSYEIAGLADRVRNIPIGRPIANTRVYILDTHLQPVPIGAVGEIHIGGSGVAEGYWNRPGLSAERFVCDPYSATPDARMYRTGDRGRWRADGVIEFLGRNDQQLKIRGFRIEPGEIEAQLVTHDQIKEAVVAVAERTPGERQLVAYVTTSGAVEPRSEELLAYLRARLPEFMIPAAIVHLQRLPLTPNGKIDRAALPKPELTSRGVVSYVAPRIEMERALCELWQSVLGLERVGVTDNFFLLGGHSLLAVRLVNAIRQQLGRSLALREFIEAPVIAELAARLNQAQEDVGLEVLDPDSDHQHEPFALTPVQLAYWIGRRGVAELGNIGAHAYAEIAVRDLDVARFEATLNRLIRRHATLRTIITSDARQQALRSVSPYRVRFEELSSLNPEQRQQRFRELRDEMSHQVFDGSAWPLFDVRVSQSSGHEFIIHCSLDALILDASSTIVLVNEFIESYLDPAMQLPPLQLSFRDYVMARERFAQSRLYREAKSHWMTRVGDFPSRPDLPLAIDPALIEHPRFERRTCQLPPRQWEVLTDLARREQVTPTVLFLSCFADVLSRWCQQPRFALNLTLFNRIPFHPQVESILGDFTTLILLALDYRDRSLSFLERLRLNQRQLWSDLEHRYFDGVEVLQALRTIDGMTAAYPVVVTSTLGLAQGPLLRDHLAKAAQNASDTVVGITQTSQVWLDVQIFEQGGGLRCNWDSVVGLFPEGMLDAMFDSFRQLLSDLATQEVQWREPVRFKMPMAHARVVATANASTVSLPTGLLHTPLLQQLGRQGQKAAVRTRAKVLSYHELELRSRVLAHHLLRGGARPDQLIAVVMEKGWQQVVAILGILRAGAAYLPIEASLPSARIALLLKNGEVRQIVTTPDALDRCPAQDSLIHLVSEAHPDDSSNLSCEPPATATPENLAYVIFTSGSTGVPKGVMIEHRAALNTVHDLNLRYRVDQGDCVLGLSSLSFDLSVYDIFGVLGAGGTLILPQPAELRDPAAWMSYLSAASGHEAVTIWNTVPALMQMLVEYLGPQGTASSLRLILLSGDWIPIDLPQRIQSVMPTAELISLGGATEASIWSIAYPIREVAPTWKSIPYGKALANQTFHVLQSDLSPAPLWVAGDIYIGGLGLARGYWRDDKQSAERFIVHPATGERLYNTGDRGRWMADGNIEFLGRTDQQVKVQGFRIELGEVEAHIKEHAAVSDAIVAVQTQRGANHLIAFVVAREQASNIESAVLDFLRSTLPGYMVPERVVPISAVPLNANGKVDRKSLPMPEWDVPIAANDEPQGRSESALAELWKQVLAIERVGRNDHFFKLGGHSLSAVQLSVQIRRTFGVDMPLRVLFEVPLLRNLSEWLDANPVECLDPAPEHIPRRGVSESNGVLLSLAQQRLWFMSQLEGAGLAYHICGAARLSGVLDQRSLIRAVDCVVERHETLRSVFFMEDTVPRQVIVDAGEAVLQVIDVSSYAANTRESRMLQLLDEQARMPFDLAVGPLLRGLLVRLSEQEHVLSITMHHIVADAWSMGVLIKEVAALYAAYKAGQPSPLPPLPIQYADYAAWQREWLHGETMQRQLDHWTGELAGAPAVLRLPTDRPRPIVQSWRGETIEFVLPPLLSERIKRWAHSQGATLFMALLAGYAVLLWKLSGQSDIVVGVPVANRRQPELAELIGLFVNALAIRIRLQPDRGVDALLDHVRQTVLLAFSNQDAPFERVVETLQPVRSLGHNPIFQALLVLQNAPQGKLELADLSLEQQPLFNHTAQFDLSVSVQDAGDRITGHFNYASDLFDRSTMARWIEYFTTLLSEMSSDPRMTLEALRRSLDGLREYEAPRGETEETLAGIWRQLLAVERVGRNDNFFELGGSSPLVVRLTSCIKQELSAELSVEEVASAADLASLAERIVDRQLAGFDLERLLELAAQMRS